MTQALPATPPASPFPLHAAGALAGDLEDWGPLEEATGEAMQTSGLTLWSDDDQEVGVWECTGGPSHWTPGDARGRLHPGGPDDGHPGRRCAAGGRHRGLRRLPARLERHVADPRDDPQAMRDLLTCPLGSRAAPITRGDRSWALTR